MAGAETKHQIVLAPLDDQAEEIERLSSVLLVLSSQYGLSLPAPAARKCVEHLLYVMQVNSYMNLTRITDLDQALVLHVLDSLLLAPHVKGSASILDMGTGAGFPGIPLAIATSSQVEMLDSVGKKVKAVQAFCNALGLSNASAVHDRIESFACSHGDLFDCVVARALAPLPVLVEYAAPLLCMGGSLILTKGQPSPEEYASGIKAAGICGLELVHQESIELPNDFGLRSILTLRKVSQPSVRLPRSVGDARSKPLV